MNTSASGGVLEDKSDVEQFNLIKQLDEEDKSTILKIIDTMLTKKKFKDSFNKNVASLWGIKKPLFPVVFLY